MKGIITVLVAAIIGLQAPLAFAGSADAEIQELCRNVGILAGAIMEARQEGVVSAAAMRDAISKLNVSKRSRTFVLGAIDLAYQAPCCVDGSSREIIVRKFRNTPYRGCLSGAGVEPKGKWAYTFHHCANASAPV